MLAVKSGYATHSFILLISNHLSHSKTDFQPKRLSKYLYLGLLLVHEYSILECRKVVFTMLKKDIELLVEKLVTEIIANTNLVLVDVEYVKEHDWYLRVYLDKEGGIDIEDCQEVSSKLEKKLDALDPIKDSYYLEVSSPGLERVLKKDRDFEEQKGNKITVHLYKAVDGKKTIVGTLCGMENNQLLLEKNGERIFIPRDNVSQVRLYLEF